MSIRNVMLVLFEWAMIQALKDWDWYREIEDV